MISWIRSNINQEEVRIIAIDAIGGYGTPSDNIEENHLRQIGMLEDVIKVLLKITELGSWLE